MGFDINELKNKVLNLLHLNRVTEALDTLFHECRVNKQLNNPEIRLLFARVLGHIGEISESLRINDEIQNESSSDKQLKINSQIYNAMIWSRLLEFEKSLSILESIEMPNDNKYLNYYLSHKLSIAIEMNDFKKSQNAINEINKYSPEDIDIVVWLKIYEKYATNESINKQNVDDSIVEVNNILNKSSKKSFTAYIFLRLGNMYEKANEFQLAYDMYIKAKERSIVGNHGIARLMILLALLELHTIMKKDHKEKLSLIKELSIVAGLHGIGLIPCNLSSKIWEFIYELEKTNNTIFNSCKNWMLSMRYMPDIGMLYGDDFEIVCLQILEENKNRIFGIDDVKIEKAPDNQAVYDIIATFEKEKIAIQCKGGKSKWTKNKLMAKLEKNDSDGDVVLFSSLLNEIKTQDNFTKYIFMCTAPVEITGKVWLDNMHNRVFQSNCQYFDNTKIIEFLLQSPSLQITVTTLINK